MLSCWKTLLTPTSDASTKEPSVISNHLIGAFKVLQAAIVLHAVFSLLWYKQYQNTDKGLGSVKITVKGKHGNISQHYDHAKSAQQAHGVGREGHSYCKDYGLCDTVKDSSFISTTNSTRDARIADLAVDINETRIYVQSQVWFRKFNLRRKNPLKSGYNCTQTNDKDCPSFALPNIISECGDNVSKIVGTSPIYGITVHWDCNIDRDINECRPYYTFRRINDHPPKGASGAASKWKTGAINGLKSGSDSEPHTGRGAAVMGSVHVLGVRVLFFMDAICGKFAVERVMAWLGMLLVRVMVFHWMRRAIFILVLKNKDCEGMEALFQADQDEDEFDL